MVANLHTLTAEAGLVAFQTDQHHREFRHGGPPRWKSGPSGQRQVDYEFGALAPQSTNVNRRQDKFAAGAARAASTCSSGGTYDDYAMTNSPPFFFSSSMARSRALMAHSTCSS